MTNQSDAMTRRIASQQKAEQEKAQAQAEARKAAEEAERKRKGTDDEGDTTVAQAVDMA